MNYLKTVAQFEIPYARYLTPEGKLEQPLPEFAKNVDELIQMYRMMVLTRQFDRRAINLQRTGKLGTYPATLGQEAIGVGIGAAMDKEDVFLPYYREYGGQLWRGVTMTEILLYWGGNELGSCFQNQSARQDFPISVPIGSQTLHAVGVAFALKYKQKPFAAVTTIGDGGTSRGDFYEAMNVAGAWDLPVVFVINNNQWAISIRREDQTKAETLAQKAIAAGLKGIQIDGNDIIAVRQAMEEALNDARQNRRATVIEAMSYRMCDHTTADDASRYRDPDEVTRHQAEDPILRIRNYLVEIKAWDKDKEKALSEEVAEKVNQAIELYLNTPVQPVTSMFDHLYETLPEAYREQYEELKTRSDECQPSH